MIDELREIFDVVALKPESEQAEIASHIKMMLESDARWEELLADPRSKAILEEMAEEAHQEYLRGETEEIKPQWSLDARSGSVNSSMRSQITFSGTLTPPMRG